MELFKTPPLLQFEKTAVPFVRMTAAVDRWPEILISSLQQQAPYMGDYEISAHIRHMDSAQGFGFGFLAAKPPTDRPLSVQAGERPVPALRIPFIVKDWQLLPFDLFMKQDTTWPLTEKRVREALFSADTFDGPAKMPGDSSIAKDLMPPAAGAQSGSGLGAGGQKLASVERPLLCEALQHEFVATEDLEKAAAMLDDTAAAWAAERHPSVLPLLRLVSDRSHEKQASSVLDYHAPSVVQITRRRDGGYTIKAASSDAFRVIEQDVDGATARATAGNYPIGDLEPGQAYTVVPNVLVDGDSEDEEQFEQVKEAGFYKVASGPRQHREVAVLPLLSFTGEKLANSWLVLNHEGHTIKTGSVAGIRTGLLSIDHSDPVRGLGFLVDPKTASASFPFQVRGLAETPEGTKILVKVGSRNASLELVPGLHGMVKLANDHYAVPSNYCFRSLPEGSFQVVSDVQQVNGWATKTASASSSSVDIIGDRTGVYTLSSPLLRDINGTEYKGVKEAQAVFILGALGVDPKFASEKLAYTRVHGPVTLRGCRPLVEATKVAAAYQGSLEKLAEVHSGLFNQPCLIKEAMEVDDIATVDKILGLNFLRPENVQMYVDYLPDLEKAVSQLADLLLAVRVGMRPLSEDAVRKALFAIEDTVQGLKTLAQTGPPDTVKTAGVGALPGKLMKAEKEQRRRRSMTPSPALQVKEAVGPKDPKARAKWLKKLTDMAVDKAETAKKQTDTGRRGGRFSRKLNRLERAGARTEVKRKTDQAKRFSDRAVDHRVENPRNYFSFRRDY